MDYLLQRMSRKINEKQRETIFSKAISFSLKHNQKGALKILLERGAALSPFSAGRRFCFVRHFLDLHSHFLDLHKSELSNDEHAGRESAGSSSSWWRKAKQKVAPVAKLNVLNAKKKQSESENQYFRAARHWQVMSWCHVSGCCPLALVLVGSCRWSRVPMMYSFNSICIISLR